MTCTMNNSTSFQSFLPNEYISMLNLALDKMSEKYKPNYFIKDYKVKCGNDTDSPLFKEYLDGPHREELLKAMKKELE